MGPFAEFNFFIGANNAGKSTVLNFIHRHLATQGKIPIKLDPLESYSAGLKGHPEMELGIRKESFLKAALDGVNDTNAKTLIKLVIEVLSEDGDMIWLKGILPAPAQSFEAKFQWNIDIRELLPKIDRNKWQAIWQHLHPGSSGGYL